ncbi:hypothetical protein BSK53_17200 [Paenibacillus odorifer]|nr:hypothetical protein BSK53_17200 [Paenibacillus odorifer]OME05794.1 hypothetical protein BSK64_12975 [Paenibacillus odorifer]
MVSQRFGIMMVIEAPRTRLQNDQMEVTFRCSYLLHALKLIIQITGSKFRRLTDFLLIQVEFNV